LGARLGLPAGEVAQGIVRLTNANMVNAIKLASVRKGHDPREYTLVAFGGGGPMHAAALARELHIRKVLVPPASVNCSACGMLTASERQDFTRTRIVRATEDGMPGFLAAYGELEAEALDVFRREGFGEDGVILARAADMRYRGQEHTVRVPVPGG